MAAPLAAERETQGNSEVNLRTALEFLRDPRVRAAPEAERLSFLEQRAGLTRGDALEVLRLASLEAPRETHQPRGWGALAALGIAIGGGLALLARERPRGDDGVTPEVEPLPKPSQALLAAAPALDAVRELLAAQEARHERSMELLREQLALLLTGSRTTTAALEQLSARLDEMGARHLAGTISPAAADAPKNAPAFTGSSEASCFSPSGCLPSHTPDQRALLDARAELYWQGATPSTPAGQTVAERGKLCDTRASLEYLADPQSAATPTFQAATPAPLAAPPPTPASAVPAPSLTVAQVMALVQSGEPVPGFVHLDDSPLTPQEASRTPAAHVGSRIARAKPWERAAVAGAAARTESPLSLISEPWPSSGRERDASPLSHESGEARPLEAPHAPFSVKDSARRFENLSQAQSSSRGKAPMQEPAGPGEPATA